MLMLEKMIDVSGKQIDVEYFLIEAYTDLYAQFSKDWVSYEIDYKKERFVFEMPMTREDEERQIRYKKRFLELLLKETMNLAVEDAMREGEEYAIDDVRNPFFKLNFLRSLDVEKEDYESPIVPESYQEVKDEVGKEKKAVAIDLDSYYVLTQIVGEGDVL